MSTPRPSHLLATLSQNSRRPLTQNAFTVASGREDHPVVYVSRHAALAYAALTSGSAIPAMVMHLLNNTITLLLAAELWIRLTRPVRVKSASASDVLPAQVMVGEESVDIASQVTSNHLGDLRRKDDAESFLGDIPAHDVLGVWVEDRAAGHDDGEKGQA